MADESVSSALQKAHAEAYKAYVRVLKENLADIDVEALDASQAQYIPVVNSWHTWNSWNTWNTFHTWNTIATVATESSIQ